MGQVLEGLPSTSSDHRDLTTIRMKIQTWLTNMMMIVTTNSIANARSTTEMFIPTLRTVTVETTSSTKWTTTEAVGVVIVETDSMVVIVVRITPEMDAESLDAVAARRLRHPMATGQRVDGADPGIVSEDEVGAGQGS